jgi:hypothetical protein
MKTEKSNDNIQKPASQYLISVAIGVLVLILLAVISYYGIFQNYIL